MKDIFQKTQNQTFRGKKKILCEMNNALDGIIHRLNIVEKKKIRELEDIAI